MEGRQWRAYYERLALPYVLAFCIATAGVAVGFVYPALTANPAVTPTTLGLRWLGIVCGLFGSAAVVWWYVIGGHTSRLVAGTLGLGIVTAAEAVGGAWLILLSVLATSLFALLAAALFAVSLVLVILSLAVVIRRRLTYGNRLLVWHAVLAAAAGLGLLAADRALPFESNPVIGLIFVIVPFVALLEMANAEIVRLWLEAESRPVRPAADGM